MHTNTKMEKVWKALHMSVRVLQISLMAAVDWDPMRTSRKAREKDRHGQRDEEMTRVRTGTTTKRETLKDFGTVRESDRNRRYRFHLVSTATNSWKPHVCE